MRQALFLFLTLASGLFFGCNQKPATGNASSKAMDSFVKSQMALPNIEKQLFEINATDTTIVEGKNGTVILFSKDCFIDDDGNAVNDNIKLELVEALSLNDMLQAGLSTKDANGKILKSGGMIYLQAYHNGTKLNINPEKAPYIEIPTNNKVNGMMVYQGAYDSKNGFHWTSPRPLENYLIHVDLESLNFRPKGFDEELSKNLPFKKHHSFSEELADSLYYSFRIYSFGENEQDYPKDDSYNAFGINPSKIKAIRQKKFDKTFIATREFAQRLQAIFATCEGSILDIYMANLHQDLWVSDSLAAAKLMAKNPVLSATFKRFAQQRLTNTRNAPKNSDALNKYYQQKLKQVQKQLLKKIEKIKQQDLKLEKEYQKVSAEYNELIQKNEDYRKEKYGFTQTSTGWINIDIGTEEKEWDYFNIDVDVANGSTFDRVLGYFVFPNIRGIYTLQVESNEKLISHNNVEIPKYTSTKLLVIAYKGDKAFIDTTSFIATKTSNLKLDPKPISKSNLKSLLNSYDTEKSPENNIKVMLKLEKKLYDTRKKQLERQAYIDLYTKLADLVFPCQNTRMLYQTHCSSCHECNSLVGPELGGITKRRTLPWLVSFISNPYAMIISGDLEAVALAHKYQSAGVMSPFKDVLTGQQIYDIILYADQLPRCKELELE